MEDSSWEKWKMEFSGAHGTSGFPEGEFLGVQMDSVYSVEVALH
jgi:hypothetical protein